MCLLTRAAQSRIFVETSCRASAFKCTFLLLIVTGGYFSINF